MAKASKDEEKKRSFEAEEPLRWTARGLGIELSTAPKRKQLLTVAELRKIMNQICADKKVSLGSVLPKGQLKKESVRATCMELVNKYYVTLPGSGRKPSDDETDDEGRSDSE